MCRTEPRHPRGPVRTGLLRQPAGALVHPAVGRLQADLPELRLHLSAGEGDLDPRRPGLDALLVYAEPPWPADMQVHVLAEERIGPVLSPHFAGYQRLQGAPAKALLEEAVLHTTSRPQAWPTWAAQQGLEPAAMHYGQAFEHLYYLLEAAVAGLGVAIAPQPLVADDLRAGRLSAPWGFSPTPAALALWVPRRAADGRAEQLAQWLRAELLGQSA
ncbi:LysR substrate-binding domain-containing protein [Pseudomonas juntendi]|nr:LysR substrate-binding domain-containing protein [Pseudomonas juntendi]